MMVGSSIQATRSSNSETLIKRVRDAVAQGKRFTMISVEDLPDDWTIVIPSAIGGGGAWEYVRERADKQKLPLVEEPMLKAIQALSKHIGKPFQAVGTNRSRRFNPHRVPDGQRPRCPGCRRVRDRPSGPGDAAIGAVHQRHFGDAGRDGDALGRHDGDR